MLGSLVEEEDPTQKILNTDFLFARTNLLENTLRYFLTYLVLLPSIGHPLFFVPYVSGQSSLWS